MKKTFLVIAVLSVVLVGCDKNAEKASPVIPSEEQTVQENHNVLHSVDWIGDYTGVEPCGDCSGIDTRLTLNADNTFKLIQAYQGESATPFTTEGSFTWNNAGNTISLDLGNGDVTQYLVAENRIFHLTKNGQLIEGDLSNAYILKKQASK